MFTWGDASNNQVPTAGPKPKEVDLRHCKVQQADLVGCRKLICGVYHNLILTQGKQQIFVDTFPLGCVHIHIFHVLHEKDGRVIGFGSGADYQLGTGERGSQNNPIFIAPAVLCNNVLDLAAGWSHSVFLVNSDNAY